MNDELQTAYLQLDGLQLLGLAQRTCGDMQLCQESKGIFFHFVETLANNGVFLICKVDGVSILESSEKWNALFNIVDGELQQLSMTYIQQRRPVEEDAFQILATAEIRQIR